MSRIDFANKLKAALESNSQPAAVAAEPEPVVASTEDAKGRMYGSAFGVLANGHMNVKIEKKKKELEELHGRIAELKARVHSAESYVAARESHQGEWTEALEGAYWEGVKAPYKDPDNKWYHKHVLGTHTARTGDKQGDAIKELNEKIAEARAEISKLEAEHSGKLHAAKEEFAAELSAGLEGYLSISEEAMSSGKGALIGGLGGAIGTAYIGHHMEKKSKELHEVEQEIRELEAELRGMHSARESLDAALEGAGTGFMKGAAAGVGGNLIAGPLGGIGAQAALGAGMGKKLQEVEQKLEAAKAKRAELKRELHGAAVASREDISNAYGAVLEGVGHTVAGAVGGVIATGIMGHKIASKKEELEALKKKIAEKKTQIAELSHHASTEAIGDSTGAGIGHGLVGGLVAGGLGTGYVGHKQGKQLDELNKQLDEHKEELSRLEHEYQAKLHSARESLTNDLLSSMESEAVIAAPAGGTETIIADEAPHRVEDHLLAADACCDAMDSHLDEAGKLHRAVAQLESLMTVVRGEPNGLSQADAKYVTLAVEHITADFAADVKLVPSIEAFGGPVSSQEATWTLEGNVKEVATQIWAYLKELWAKFMAALKNMWSHLFGAAESLGRHAKNLEAKANAITGEPREASVDIGPLAHRVAVGGQVPASLKGILTFMKLGELKSVAEKALDESEITAAVQKMSTGGNVADVAVDASMRESFKTMPILNRELPGGVTYTLSDTGEVHREVAHAQVANTSIAVLSRVDLIHLGHEAGAMAAEAAGVLKDLAAATAKDAGNFLSAINIEDEARAREVSHAVSVMVAERKRGLKLVSDAITDYLKAAQALVAIGEKCVAKYGAAGHVEQAVDATKAAVAGAVDSAKAAGAAVAAKVAPAQPEPAAAPAAAAA